MMSRLVQAELGLVTRIETRARTRVRPDKECAGLAAAHASWPFGRGRRANVQAQAKGAPARRLDVLLTPGFAPAVPLQQCIQNKNSID